MLAGDEPGQVFALLRFGAVAADLVDAQVGMRAVRQADRGRGARDLLHGADLREVAHGAAAVVLLDGHAEQAEAPELAPQVRRKLVRLVDPGGARRDLLGGEVLHRFAQHGDGLAVIEAKQVHSGASGVLASIIRVCCIEATCLPPSSAYTSARAMVRVRPGFTTWPLARSAPRAGERILILYSTVTSEQPAGISEKAL